MAFTIYDKHGDFVGWTDALDAAKASADEVNGSVVDAEGGTVYEAKKGSRA